MFDQLFIRLAFVVLLSLSSVAQAQVCTSNRPGWPDHRTLFVPSWMMSNPSTQDMQWQQALCCVYTHVQMVGNSATATMRIYDGSTYSMGNTGNSFSALASRAMNDICAMSMGSEDCARQRQCVNQAFATGATPTRPLNPPTTTSCARIQCASGSTCSMINGQAQCVPQSLPQPVVPQPPTMCALRDVCSRASTVQSCRMASVCCSWNMLYGCIARQRFQCYPWMDVPCGV